MDQATNPPSRRVIIGVTDNQSTAIPTGHSRSEALEQLYESESVVCGLIVEVEAREGKVVVRTRRGYYARRKDRSSPP